MIHLALSIPIGSANLDIDGERLKQLQKRLNGVNYFVIDEKSMVGHRMLALVDMRLCQAFPEHKNQPFGNRSVILVGDFGQLPPVLDEPMYSQTFRHDLLSNDGITTYKQFQEAYKLDIVQCQSGDSEEQRNFRDILLQLRDGESTVADWKVLAARFIDSPTILSPEQDHFSDAICIFPWKIDVNEFNVNKLKTLNCPIARINAIHTGGNEARKADYDTAKGLEAQLFLARGARVMLRANLWTEFDNYAGPAITTIEGLTLQKAVIDLGKKEYAAGISFVAISQACALRNILFRPFSLDRLQRIKTCKRLQERMAEEG
ncbi:21470_t:CDS:2 [Cetraspora pellucida]|uniref:ATP-dependent DNA helicase n=1 Tax=Cetraspora pellucida TaxID=1433469 RepID=A0A9N9D4E3_9GLOM|nr:21470_t:CDS:2 [Cetraspora pellucida]